MTFYKWHLQIRKPKVRRQTENRKKTKKKNKKKTTTINKTVEAERTQPHTSMVRQKPSRKGLTHFSLETFKRVIGKQYRPISDADDRPGLEEVGLYLICPVIPWICPSAFRNHFMWKVSSQFSQ